jgi:rRNA maturation endonuclease Nob1
MMGNMIYWLRCKNCDKNYMATHQWASCSECGSSGEVFNTEWEREEDEPRYED